MHLSSRLCCSGLASRSYLSIASHHTVWHAAMNMDSAMSAHVLAGHRLVTECEIETFFLLKLSGNIMLRLSTLCLIDCCAVFSTVTCNPSRMVVQNNFFHCVIASHFSVI